MYVSIYCGKDRLKSGGQKGTGNTENTIHLDLDESYLELMTKAKHTI